MGAFLIGMAFLARAEARTDKLPLAVGHHLAQHLSQREATLKASRVVALHMLPHAVPVNDPQLKRFRVQTIFLDLNRELGNNIERPIDGDEISSGRPLSRMSAGVRHAFIILV